MGVLPLLLIREQPGPYVGRSSTNGSAWGGDKVAYGFKLGQIAARRLGRFRGDPGLFGSIGKLVGKVSGVVTKIASPLRAIPGVGPILAKVVPKFIPGLGLISTAATVAGLASKGVSALRAGRAVGGMGSMLSMAQKGKVIGSMGAGRMLAAGAGGAAAGAGGAMLGSPGGFGSMQRALESGRAAIDPQTGQLVRTGRRYRRMRVTNMRALTRSLRRVKGFAKIARQVLVTEKRFKVKKGFRGRK